ncbi:MAG: flagellar motor switch protein FliG [Thermoguttaceae bacterium]|jgi:flagellar motor switch protein FliG
MATDIRKAAVLLMSLPQDQGAQLMSMLEPAQVEAVSIEIAKTSVVAPEEQARVIQGFASANPNALTGSVGGLEVARSLLEQALGKGANSMIDNVRQSIEGLPFGFLQKVDSQHLLTFLVDEHPQTIALILSHIPPAQASSIISGLPADRQIAVIRRVAMMQQTSPEIIQTVEKGLERRMANVMSQQFENAGGAAAVAEILNVTDRATARSILENLAQEDPDLVEEIRRSMFVFEDITKFADRDIQSILKNIENSQWATALKGASEQLKKKILANMSKRAATLLEEEMEYLGPVRASSVEQMQQQIVDVIRRLEDAGEISIRGAQEEERYIQ